MKFLLQNIIAPLFIAYVAWLNLTVITIQRQVDLIEYWQKYHGVNLPNPGPTVHNTKELLINPDIFIQISY